MMDPQTLRVKALIDWEYSGYFLSGMEKWPGTLDADAYAKRSSQLAHAIAEFVPAHYLTCYNGLDDKGKADWDRLIADGELPRHN